MARLTMNFYSDAIKKNTDVNIILPIPNSDNYEASDVSYFDDHTRFKVMYLFHGGYGDYSDWCRMSNIERYAQEHRIAVIMPSIDNTFGLNVPYGPNYFTYITEELPTLLKRLIPISDKKEDTYIAGLSMGGYCALNVALSCPENFAAVASLSGAVHFPSAGMNEFAGDNPGMWEYKALIKDYSPDNPENDSMNVGIRIKNLLDNNQSIPRVLMIYGDQDFLIRGATIELQEALAGYEDKVSFESYPGKHNWKFWDTYIQRVMDWFEE